MIAPPTLDDISGLSRAMGLGLEPDEVELVRDFVAASLPALDIPADLLRDEPRLPRTDVARTDIRQPPMPTVPFTAPLYEESASPAQNVELSLTGGTLGSLDAIVENLWPFNFVGLPALTVPCALSAGLPVGLQIVGRAHEDDLVQRAGYAFESAVDWDELTTPPFLPTSANAG